MAQHILYAYVDGADLEAIAAALATQLRTFAAGRRWLSGEVSVVNQRHGLESRSQPGDLPCWNLGLNLELPDPGSEPKGWFDDIETIACRLAEWHQSFGLDFVIGLVDTRTGATEDIFFVESPAPDLELLRRMIGDSPTTGRGGN